jgi:hypothetical protein
MKVSVVGFQRIQVRDDWSRTRRYPDCEVK